MANEDHVARLKKGVVAWNAWRHENRNIPPDLYQENLTGANLEGANLEGANLEGTDLSDANLSTANLAGANLTEANLYAVDLHRVAVLAGREVAVSSGTSGAPAASFSTDVTVGCVAAWPIVGPASSGAGVRPDRFATVGCETHL